MIFNWLRKAPEALLINVILNARLQPLDRGELEDALVESLGKRGIPVDIPSGGTLIGDNGEPKESDFDVSIENPTPEKIDEVLRIVSAMLAPKGSRYLIGDAVEPTEFGSHEGLALYLNGTDLPSEVYASCDVNHVIAECDRLLGDAGRFHSHWQGPSETALYLYGVSFDEMRKAIEPLISTYPLCQQSRIVQIA